MGCCGKLMMRVGPLVLSLDGKLLGPRRMTKKINVHPEWKILQTLTNGGKKKAGSSPSSSVKWAAFRVDIVDPKFSSTQNSIIVVVYLSDTMMLTWVRRLEISVGNANALSYIHYDEHCNFSVIHRNMDSLNILLNDNLEPKLSEFRLSMKIEASQRHHSFHVDKVWDMEGEGKSVIANDTNKYLAPMAITHYREQKLHEIIDWDLWQQMDSESFNIFVETAYGCLNEERSQRPDIDDIVPKLEIALKLACENRPVRPLLFCSIFLS
ncbi:kinase-like domain, phloem protein 2-like protein [Tanacetum coccineum]